MNSGLISIYIHPHWPWKVLSSKHPFPQVKPQVKNQRSLFLVSKLILPLDGEKSMLFLTSIQLCSLALNSCLL